MRSSRHHRRDGSQANCPMAVNRLGLGAARRVYNNMATSRCGCVIPRLPAFRGLGELEITACWTCLRACGRHETVHGGKACAAAGRRLYGRAKFAQSGAGRETGRRQSATVSLCQREVGPRCGRLSQQAVTVDLRIYSGVDVGVGLDDKHADKAAWTDDAVLWHTFHQVNPGTHEVVIWDSTKP